MKLEVTVFVLQVVVGFYETVQGIEIPDIIKICSAKDPNLSQCVKDSAQKIIPLFAGGLKDVDIPSMDPMYTPFVSFSEDNGDIQIQINYTNVEQIGLSKVVVDNTVVDLDKGIMIFNLTYPIFTFIGDYVARGHIFGSQMNGEGKANITIMNLNGDLEIRFHVENDYIKEDYVAIKYTFHKILLDYSHIVFNGDESMAKAASDFINENAVEIMEGFKPSLEKFYGGLILEKLQGMFSMVPYSMLFKDT